MLQWKELLEKGKWKKLKKSDWVVLALVGVLLLVIAMPMEKNARSKGNISSQGDLLSDNSFDTSAGGGNASGNSTKQQSAAAGRGDVAGEEAYVAYLEEKLESVLSQMEGAGEVEVMITVSDAGERVVEKDRNTTTTVTSESDSAGGNRTISENNTEEQTIYVETEDETYPYIQKEKLPTIEGVVVVAEGGGNSTVISNISEAVKALLPVEAHRIKVVKMCSKEE